MTVPAELVPALVRRADEVVAQAGADVRQLVQWHLLDTLGCLMVGVGHPSAPGLRRYVDLLDESGSVSSFVTGRPVTLRHAVALDSTYIHLDELDAIHAGAAVVPPAVVVPAALAVAARTGASGRELAAALLGGYDVMVEAAARLGGPSLYAQRWWPTAAVGALGTAWATARLLGLDEAGRCRAVALAGHATGGPIGSDALGEGHYLAAGRAAASGLEAAYQAVAGLRGDPSLLDAGLPGAADPPGPATAGVEPHLRTCAFKRYPFARPLHAALAALEELSARTPLATADRIEVQVPAPLVRFVTAARAPAGPVEAAASAAVAVAAHLAGRSDDVQFVRQAAEATGPQVELIASEDLAADLPARWSSRVVAHLPGGTVETAFAPDAPALTDEAAVVEKYWRNVAAVPPQAAEEVRAACDLDRLDDAARLRAAVARAVAPGGTKGG